MIPQLDVAAFDLNNCTSARERRVSIDSLDEPTLQGFTWLKPRKRSTLPEVESSSLCNSSEEDLIEEPVLSFSQEDFGGSTFISTPKSRHSVCDRSHNDFPSFPALAFPTMNTGHKKTSPCILLKPRSRKIFRASARAIDAESGTIKGAAITPISMTEDSIIPKALFETPRTPTCKLYAFC